MSHRALVIVLLTLAIGAAVGFHLGGRERFPLSMEERIRRAEAVYNARREFYERECRNRYVVVYVDVDGGVHTQISTLRADWVTAYREFVRGGFKGEGAYIVDLWPRESQ